MTKFDLALSRWKALPAAQREEIAELVIDAIEGVADYELTPEQAAELERRLAGPDDFATDEETEAFFARHRS